MADPIELDAGALTSEGQLAAKASTWGIVIAVLGGIATLGAVALQTLGIAPDSTSGIVAGAVIAIAGVLQKTLTTISYNQGRVSLKGAQINANAKIAIVNDMPAADKKAA